MNRSTGRTDNYCALAGRAARPFRLRRATTPALAGVMMLALALAPPSSTPRAKAQALSCGINQITFTAAGRTNRAPAVSADGTLIAFQSDADLMMNGRNADGNEEIFLYDTRTGAFTQVTDTTGGLTVAGPISADGTRVAVTSDGYPNFGNADGSREIFLATCLVPQPPPAPRLGRPPRQPRR